MKKDLKSRIALFSVIIGDGYVSNRSGQVKLVHSEKQLEYLQWKQRYIKGHGYSVSTIRLFNSNGYSGYTFNINARTQGKLFSRILYSRGYKHYYKRKLLNRLEPIHLAIWYMDDGCLSQKKVNGKVHANDLILNTYTTKENNQILIDYFNEVWDIRFTQVKSKGHYRLRCGTREARKFIKIVYPFVSQLKCMQHKLNIKS